MLDWIELTSKKKISSYLENFITMDLNCTYHIFGRIVKLLTPVGGVLEDKTLQLESNDLKWNKTNKK